MAADELGAPLSPRSRWQRLREIRISPLGVAAVLAGILFCGLALWLSLAADPLGGEPVVVLRIENGGGAGVSAASPDLGMRTGLGPGDSAEASMPQRPADAADADIIDVDGEDGPARRGLSRAPQPGMTEAGRFGPLPRIAADGRRPGRVYARPASEMLVGGESGARIAILIGGMGISASGTEEAIRRLPPEVSLAFAPYPDDLQDAVDRARRYGHEVMLQIPMEPFDYPANDPGPYTLLTTLSAGDNEERLEWLMSRFTGYFGVTNYMGARFTAAADSLRPALKQFSARGLVYVDDGSSARSRAQEVAEQVGLASAAGDVTIDADPTPQDIDEALERLEEIARERGFALGVGSGLPVTIDRVAEWVATLHDKGIVLVPVSASVPSGQT